MCRGLETAASEVLFAAVTHRIVQDEVTSGNFVATAPLADRQAGACTSSYAGLADRDLE